MDLTQSREGTQFMERFHRAGQILIDVAEQLDYIHHGGRVLGGVTANDILCKDPRGATLMSRDTTPGNEAQQRQDVRDALAAILTYIHDDLPSFLADPATVAQRLAQRLSDAGVPDRDAREWGRVVAMLSAVDST